MLLISILSLVLSITSIFVGGGKGIAMWVIGTIALIIAGNFLGNVIQMYSNHQGPILLATAGIQVVAILISRWWGLVFYFVASVGLTLVLFLGALATMTVG